ncbi:MAG TPA: hypothetical protein VLT33_11125, partial [Labilithrix sp.]|nr:hypothetical protein [Labilithrix sp.]
MRRFQLLVLGIAIAGGTGTFGMYTAAHREGAMAGALYAGSMVAIVIGVLIMLAGLQKTEGPSFDPGARITEHAWSNDEQAWTLGEALGMSLWTLRKVGGKLALVALVLPVLFVAGGFVGGILTPTVARTLGDVLAMIGQADRARSSLVTFEVSAAISLLFGLIALAFVSAPLLKLSLAALRSEKVTFEAASGSLKYAPRLLAFGALYTFLLVLSAPLLCMPVMPFVLTPFFIVDQDLGVIAGMRK